MDNEMKNEILSAIGMVEQKVDIMQEDMNEMKKQVAKIPEIEKQVAKIPKMEKQIANMQKDIVELKEETRNISRSVAVIENEHGEKLSALFDAFTMSMEKAERQDKKNDFFENKLEKHDAEIYYLNTKVQGL